MSANAPPIPLPPEVERRIQAGAFLLVDKPRGPSSHQVTAWVRDLLGLPRAGHAGTLDPNVSGLLWIGVGPALKLLPLMLEFPKRYVAVVDFHGPVARSALAPVLAEFTGPIFQTPPVRSAVRRRRRVRVVHFLELLELSGPRALLDTRVDSGTYIRSLAVDLGDALGIGAHMVELRRTATGPFEENRATRLAELSDALHRARSGDTAGLLALLHPLEEVTRAFAQVRLKPGAASAIAHGADLAAGGIDRVEGRFARGDSVVLVAPSGELLALGTALKDSEHLDGAGWVIDATRVLADPLDFPPTWRKGAGSGGGRPRTEPATTPRGA
ncbi:MAG: RNA-guided pseudouridylation complex pseudouridine synthase subunit Cbf5 [Thermoplasmata archaeon]